MRMALLVVCAAAALAAWASRPHAPAAYATDRAVIGVVGRADGRDVARVLGLRAVEWLPKLGAVEVAGPPARLAQLSHASDPRIRYFEPLETARLAHIRNDPLTYEGDPATGAPWEWQFHTIGTDQALSIAHGVGLGSAPFGWSHSPTTAQ